MLRQAKLKGFVDIAVDVDELDGEVQYGGCKGDGSIKAKEEHSEFRA